MPNEEITELHLDGKVAEAQVKRSIKPRFWRPNCIYYKNLQCDAPECGLEACFKCPYGFLFGQPILRKTVDVVAGIISFFAVLF